MFPRVKSVRHVKDCDVEVTFSNGERRVVPLWDEVVSKGGDMSKPLRDIGYFKKLRVARDFGTIEWPNGYDICPDVLYWLATGEPITWATDPKFQSPPAHLVRQTTKKRAAKRKLVRPAQRR